MISNDLLIEIGTEELPPKLLSRMMRSLADNFGDALTKAQFSFGNVKSFATPRRLSFIVSQLGAEQPTQMIERRGPSLKAAYDDSGALTKAASGFMRSVGIDDIDQLEQIETPKGTWLVFKQEKVGAKLEQMISELLSASIAKLPIERKMRWGSNRSEFVRPVHWLVALYGDEVLATEMLGLGASNQSMGHRFMSDGILQIDSANTYVEQLRAAKVMVDFGERKTIIEAQLKAIGEQEKATVVIDPALLDEVTALVEWPVCLMGRFDKGFLAVPEEALISAMKEHQRYFHLVDQNGKLLPRFITVSNIESTHPDSVIKGNERVIAPRLSDAKFFYSKDKETTLATKLDRLSHVVFQAKLGNYGEKTQRISKLAGYIAEEIGANKDHAERAGLLCKADLVSDMVGEFTDLQGLMGGYYAEYDGEAEDVCTAIADHYKPTGSGSDLPRSPVACAVAIADKMDTITGLFGIGQPPTGSRDPFAIRRQTLGIIRICIENNLNIGLASLIEKSADIYDQGFKHDDILKYFLDRLDNWYQDLGITSDTYNAIRRSAEPIAHLALTDQRVKSLQAFKAHPRAEQLVAANKRIANILKKTKADTISAVDETLFLEPVETVLFNAVNASTNKLAGTEDFEAKYLILAELQPVIDTYFEEVMVMADDVKVKSNRLAMLSQMRGLFLSVADLSLLQQ